MRGSEGHISDWVPIGQAPEHVQRAAQRVRVGAHDLRTRVIRVFTPSVDGSTGKWEQWVILFSQYERSAPSFYLPDPLPVFPAEEG